MTGAPDSIAWVDEKRMLTLCATPRSTWQNWVRAGAVDDTTGGTYGETEVLNVVIAARLRAHFGLTDVVSLLRAMRLSGTTQELCSAAATLPERGGWLDLVVEVDTNVFAVARDALEIVQAVRQAESPRPVIVIPLATDLSRAYRGFWIHAIRTPRPTRQLRGVKSTQGRTARARRS